MLSGALGRDGAYGRYVGVDAKLRPDDVTFVTHEQGPVYADGQRDDGRVYVPPTDNESIILQRQIIRDMKSRPDMVITDPWSVQPMSVQELFDQHARVLLVITEVESRHT